MKRGVRVHESVDGTLWAVDVKVPSHSSAMVLFKHPNGDTNRRDRYAWYNAHSPEAHDPRARLSAPAVLSSLTDQDITTLFRRSMPVAARQPDAEQGPHGAR